MRGEQLSFPLESPEEAKCSLAPGTSPRRTQSLYDSNHCTIKRGPDNPTNKLINDYLA